MEIGALAKDESSGVGCQGHRLKPTPRQFPMHSYEQTYTVPGAAFLVLLPPGSLQRLAQFTLSPDSNLTFPGAPRSHQTDRIPSLPHTFLVCQMREG